MGGISKGICIESPQVDSCGLFYSQSESKSPRYSQTVRRVVIEDQDLYLIPTPKFSFSEVGGEISMYALDVNIQYQNRPRGL